MEDDGNKNSAKGFLLTILWWGFLALVVFFVLGVITNGFEGPNPPLDLDILPPD